MTFKFSRCHFVFAVLAFLASSMLNAFAMSPDGRIVTVRNDTGGQIIDYVIKLKRMVHSQRSVRFDGRCESACTLFLAMPTDRTCITSRSKFGFHRPFGSTARGNQIAADYLHNNYPGWVRQWLNENGGLNGHLKVMPFAYASQYLEVCKPGRATVTAATLVQPSR